MTDLKPTVAHWRPAGEPPVPPWEWRVPDLPPGLEAAWVGNRGSRLYHEPGCRNAARIGERRRVAFASAAEAEAAGYRPGGCCR